MMIKLLRGDYVRLWKSTVFRLFLAATFICTMYSITLFDTSVKSPDFLFVMDMPASVIAAICIAALIGIDYHNGTIRNKLSVGHSRVSVYFSNLIVSSTAAILLYIERILIVLAAAVPIHGELSQPISENLLMIGANMMCILAFSAIYVLIAALNTNMTAGSVIALLTAFGMYFAAVWTYNKQQCTEYMWSQARMDDKIVSFIVKNPSYVELPMRTGLLLLYDVLPNGQMAQLTEAAKKNTQWSRANYDSFNNDFDLYYFENQTSAYELIQLSFAVMLACTTCGVFLFCQKDLK